MSDEHASLLEAIRRAFASGDEELGHELMADAIERHELPAETVAAALSDGLAAWGPAEVGSR